MRWFIAMGMAFAMSAATFAQDMTDTTLRAAYCVGVLKYSVDEMRQRGVDAPLPELREMAAELQKDPQNRGKRYATYLALRMDRSTDDALSSITQKWIQVLMAKGYKDAREKIAAPDHPGVARCLKSPPQSSVAAIVDCIGEYDQVYANIIRCQKMPDQLPF